MSVLGNAFFARELIARAAEEAGVAADLITGPSRKREACEIRWACMHVMREHGMSLSQIGRRLHRDHSTVLSGLQRAEQLRGDKGFALFVEAIA